jgi:predicted nucleic acid-binding protein
MEVLQGIRDDKEYANALASFDSFILLPMTQPTFIKAAELYRILRRRGLTICNAVDCMIAAVALEHDVPLLHNDRDFDAIESLGILKIVETKKPTIASIRREARRR